jgi:hypothetical protein
MAAQPFELRALTALNVEAAVILPNGATRRMVGLRLH